MDSPRISIKKNYIVIFVGFCFLSLAIFFFLSRALAQQTVQNNNTQTRPQQGNETEFGPASRLAIEFYPHYPKSVIKPGMNRKLVERGKYLVKIGDCIACHTNTDEHGAPFAGGLAIKTPFGTFFTPNITPDKETGIGDWSIDDFIRAMHEGINPQGQYYFPVFPYPSFTKVSEQDLIAIKAYLDSIPAVKQKNKIPTAPWPFSWRFAQFFWRALFFDRGFYHYDSDKSPQWNRGAYIVQGLGHCGECHTPRNLLGAMKTKYYLTGAFVNGFWAPDITGIGLETATAEEVEKVFTEEKEIDEAGPVRGPMAEVDHDSLKYMKQSDLEAIAIYLKSLKTPEPREPHIAPAKEREIKPAQLGEGKLQFDPQTLKIGAKIYNNVCAMCHETGAAGAPRIYDTANWTIRLEKGLPELYKNAIQGFNQMPPRGGCSTCTDEEIKAAVDYILSESQEPEEIMTIKGEEAPRPDTSIELGKKVYDKVCSLCHADGRLGAPKLGDQAAWQPRVKKNLDLLILNTLHGIGNMPARGGCNDCTTAEIIAAVKYMAQQANPQGDYKLW